MQMDWMPILSKVLEAVLIAVLPPLAVGLVGLVVALFRKWWIQAKEYAPQVTDLLEEAAKMAVRAAEQAGIAQLIEDKKQYAIQIVELWLEARHVSVDIDLIDAAIEAAVLKEFNKPETRSATERFLDAG
jgi:hypothetical protein